MDPILELVQSWLRDVTVLNLDAGTLARTLAILTGLTTLIQTIKKVAEWASNLPLINRIPIVRTLIESVAHGQGPVIINIVLTTVTLAAAAFSDGRLTGAEGWAIIAAIAAAILGNDWLYKLMRGKVFPKGDSYVVDAATAPIVAGAAITTIKEIANSVLPAEHQIGRDIPNSPTPLTNG